MHTHRGPTTLSFRPGRQTTSRVCLFPFSFSFIIHDAWPMWWMARFGGCGTRRRFSFSPPCLRRCLHSRCITTQIWGKWGNNGVPRPRASRYAEKKKWLLLLEAGQAMAHAIRRGVTSMIKCYRRGDRAAASRTEEISRKK